MRTNKGFTLTEVLLGVMIVGLIGIALAALTTSASRDSGQSSSRIMVRNSISMALRQIRQDIHDASKVVDGSIEGALTSNTDRVLMTLVQNQMVSQTGSQALRDNLTVYYTTYCYIHAPTTDGIVPTGSAIGGQIKRLKQANSQPTVDDCKTNGTIVLNNVKYVPAGTYPAPLFQALGGTLGSILRVNLIVELPSTPVINDVVEDIFVLPNGIEGGA